MFDRKQFSLALGGGGARGLAHIGAIQYLEERSWIPRAVSGTSMGSIIASLVALGKSSEDMISILKDIQWLNLIDFDMRRGLIRGAKIERFLDEIFEGKSFCDTQFPLYITSTDIHTGEGIVFSEGRISEAVRASIGIPGVFAPYIRDKHELVDGGLTMNLPIELLPPGSVIAVSAMRDLGRKIAYKRKIFDREWQKTIFGNSYNIIQKTIDIMLSQNESRSRISRDDIIFIRPEFDRLDYYEFNKYREFINSGYKKAGEVLSGIKSSQASSPN